MSYWEQTYEKGFSEGYLEGYDRSRAEQAQRSDGGKAGTIFIGAALWLMAGFSIIASIIEIFGLA